jgi:hypothetical protein
MSMELISGIAGDRLQFRKDVFPGTYLIVIEDDLGCTGTQIIEIEHVEYNIEFQLVITGQQCISPGSIVTSSIVPGEGPFNFFLNNISQPDGIFTGLLAGSYIVEVSDQSGCVGSIAAEVE